MERFTAPDGTQLTSLHAINDLPQAQRERIYLTLINDELLRHFDIDPETLCDPEGHRLVTIDAPSGTSSVEARVWPRPGARDPALYFQLADTANNQLMVLLFVINDPDSPRFDVDRNWAGERTKFGTMTRNVEAEAAAMKAGLAPGQMHRGLKMARKMLPDFEAFVAALGREMFLLEPLAYHTAILFERYGCNYSLGKKKMEMIQREFQPPNGELFKRLDGSTPFRMPGAEKTVRGRSWAIHDGILGEPFTDIHMYKRVGVNAGIETFPNAIW
jgi:hypothetical protein